MFTYNNFLKLKASFSTEFIYFNLLSVDKIGHNTSISHVKNLIIKHWNILIYNIFKSTNVLYKVTPQMRTIILTDINNRP